MPGHSTLTEKDMRRKGYILVAEAARKITVSPQTIYRWIESEGVDVDGFREGYRRYVMWETILDHLGPKACRIRGFKKSDVMVPTPPEEKG